ncbi:MAG TPA: hypothetical protein PKY25_03080 [Bacilli bacterium]|nr:hypothetical protein [Bacilli bacterium]
MKNKKGFFLAETIVMTSIVVLTITLIFPQFANRYERMKARLVSYNRAPDVMTADYIYSNIDNLASGTCTPGTNYYVFAFDTPKYSLNKIIQATTVENIKTNYTDGDINLTKFLNSIENPTSGYIFVFEFEYSTVRRYVKLYRSTPICPIS